MLIGLPESTLQIVQQISQKTGKAMVDVISEGIVMMADKHLAPEYLGPNVKSRPQILTERR